MRSSIMFRPQASRNDLAKRTLEDLPNRVAFEKLSRDGQVDYEMLGDALKLELWSDEHGKPRQKSGALLLIV